MCHEEVKMKEKLKWSDKEIKYCIAVKGTDCGINKIMSLSSLEKISLGKL